MSFFARIYQEKRAVIVPLAIALVANAVIYAVAVYPLGRKVDAAVVRSQQAEQGVRRAETLYARAQSVAEGKAQATEELRAFYEDVLPHGLSGARRITYVRLAQLAAENGLDYERRTVRTERDRDATLARLEMTMVLAGGYTNIRQFIHDLETDAEFLVIRDVALSQGEEGQAPLVLTVSVATYFVPETDGS